jgi:predicted nucleotidyltransferase
MQQSSLAIAAGAADPATVPAGTRLPIARYRFTFRMRADLRLPEFSGSLLRGQFGAALRRAACITRARTCDGCPLLATCPYPAIFATPAPAEHPLQKFSAVPNPYVIEPPPLGTRFVAAGENLSFALVLVGRALDQLPLIVYALQRAFGRGIGTQRAAGDLHDIVHEDADGGPASVWDAGAGRVLAHAPHLALPAFGAPREARLVIDTPLRLQDNGRPLHGRDLSPRRLVTALVRRAALLFEFHAGQPGLGAGAGARARPPPAGGAPPPTGGAAVGVSRRPAGSRRRRRRARRPRRVVRRRARSGLARLDPLLVATATGDDARRRARHLDAARRSRPGAAVAVAWPVAARGQERDDGHGGLPVGDGACSSRINLRRSRLSTGSCMHALIESNRAAILEIAAKYRVADVRVFGSMARGDATDSSDVDLLVRPLPGASLLDLGGLSMDVQDLLGRHVDVVSERALIPELRERILSEAQPL